MALVSKNARQNEGPIQPQQFGGFTRELGHRPDELAVAIEHAKQ